MNKLSTAQTQLLSNVRQEIIIFRGIPGSGKTMQAKALCRARPSFVRINRDDIRLMLGVPFSKHNEYLVNRIREASIMQTILSGWSVVVDDTNIAGHNITVIQSLSETFNVVVSVYDVITPVWLCVLRDAKRSSPVGAETIQRMAAEFEQVRLTIPADVEIDGSEETP